MRCDGDMPTRLRATDLPATRILVPEGKGSAVREPMERTWAGKGLLEVASTKARFDMAAERSEAGGCACVRCPVRAGHSTCHACSVPPSGLSGVSEASEHAGTECFTVPWLADATSSDTGRKEQAGRRCDATRTMAISLVKKGWQQETARQADAVCRHQQRPNEERFRPERLSVDRPRAEPLSPGRPRSRPAASPSSSPFSFLHIDPITHLPTASSRRLLSRVFRSPRPGPARSHPSIDPGSASPFHGPVPSAPSASSFPTPSCVGSPWWPLSSFTCIDSESPGLFPLSCPPSPPPTSSPLSPSFLSAMSAAAASSTTHALASSSAAAASSSRAVTSAAAASSSAAPTSAAAVASSIAAGTSSSVAVVQLSSSAPAVLAVASSSSAVPLASSSTVSRASASLGAASAIPSTPSAQGTAASTTSLSAGAIGGIVGGVVGALALAFLVWTLWKWILGRRYRRDFPLP